MSDELPTEVREATTLYRTEQQSILSTDELEDLILRFAEEIDPPIRLSAIGDLFIWELSAGFEHQEALMQAVNGVHATQDSRADCDCFRLPDTVIRFPDGSIHAPDISIWCRRPKVVAGGAREIPDAVIEIIGLSSPKKDLEILPPFYLAHGVKDVVVLHMKKAKTIHFRYGSRQEHDSPVTLNLECGCTCTV